MTKLNIVTKEIQCLNEVLTITNQRAMYWKKKNSLILSDIHIGKSAHFQKSGISIPSSILAKDLERLAQLIQYFKVENLLIVGDLFHAEYNKELDEFKLWLSQFSNLRIQLIKGNHDRLKLSIYDALSIEIFNSELILHQLKFVHDFIKPDNNLFTISGHTHPGVLLKGKGKQRIKIPCFQVTNHQLILPAFSLFTGLNTKQAPKNCKNYGFTDDGIFEL